MRAAAKEVLSEDENNVDALAIMAEVAVYMQDEDEARSWLAHAEERDAENLRVQLVRAALFAIRFSLQEEIETLLAVMQATERTTTPEDKTQPARYIRMRALGWLADAWLLSGEPEHAMQTLFELSRYADSAEEAASFYSKGLFCSNYRTRPMQQSKALHEGYDTFFSDVKKIHPLREQEKIIHAQVPPARKEMMTAADAIAAVDAAKKRVAERRFLEERKANPPRLWSWEQRAQERLKEAERVREALFHQKEQERQAEERKKGFLGRVLKSMETSKEAISRPAEGKQRTRRIRIGYISPDFRLHAAAYFFTPLLRDFDGTHFEVICYAIGRRDRVTQFFKRHRVAWRDVSRLSARDAARQIAKDKLDILVDLSGHTQDTALPILAHRPAPVQISAIGYMNTTGMKEVDYFLSDLYCAPYDMGTTGFTEKVLRLPHTHICYAPDIREMPEPAAEPPCVKNGYITFGSFNNFSKVSEEVLQLWRSILDRLPTAKLLIKSKITSIPSGREIVIAKCRAFGIDEERLVLEPYSEDYLECYAHVDIAIDTFPYTGGLTTCEALYMGVPVITRAGTTHGARFSAGILQNAGLVQLIAKGDLDYLRKAVELAGNMETIRKLRKTLRARVQSSRLMDGEAYMRELESLYDQIAEE